MDGSNHLVKSGYYDKCTLFGEKTTDEDGHTLTVFTDKLGRKILERREANYGYNDTYYVYNDLGQLRFVLSPEYQNAGKKAIYAYEYRYDNRGNIVKKILPQCEYIQYWYDKADRMTFMQDGRMRQQGLYRFYLYDNLSRVVVEGTCSGGNRGKTVRNAVFNASASGLLGTGYTVDNSLNLASPKLETVNYYDDYGYLNLPLFKDNAALKKTAAPSSPVCAQGLATGSINATNRGELLLTSLYYDIKGEVTEMRRTLPGDALLTAKNTYTFTGNIANTEEMLYKNGKTYKAATANTYNANNDKIASASLSLDGNASHKINTISYDDLGRISEATHGAASGVDYAYNLRGWITDITARNFEEHLTYNTGNYGTPCYNGNISTQTWKTSDDGILRGYKFTYDKLNRLVSSVYGEGASFSEHVNRYSESVPEYTANGAIKKIIRHGLKQNGEYGKIDNLDISLNGNQLSRVDDDALPVLRKGATDFYDNKVKTTGAEYEYDENGALIMDANRGITRIEYDHLDNPTLIQFSDGSQTEYVYTSAGEKLRTIHRTATPNITIAMGEKKNLAKEEILEADSTDYIGGFIFENSKPSKYLFGGGYYTYAAPKAGYSNYHYFLTDHLGNNRVVENGNDSIEQVTHYYPFGGVYADAGLNANLQKYKYNSKELDQMHGLNSYDYGARQYYPTVPVWDRMDPLSEKYYSISPYAYCSNNPMRYLDPDGKIGIDGAIFGAFIGGFTEYASIIGSKVLFEHMSLWNANKNLTWRDGLNISVSAGIGAASGVIDNGISRLTQWISKPRNRKIVTKILDTGMDLMEDALKQYIEGGQISVSSMLVGTLTEIGMGDLIGEKYIKKALWEARSSVNRAQRRLNDLRKRRYPNAKLIRKAKEKVKSAQGFLNLIAGLDAEFETSIKIASKRASEMVEDKGKDKKNR